MRTARWMIAFAAVVGLVFALAPTGQAGPFYGPYGIAYPTGTNPLTGQEWTFGDQYRLVFVTSTTRDASSTNIADYNTFVNAAADASSLPGVKDVTWYAIGSTSTVSAKTNTGTTGTGVPIYLIDATTLVFKQYSGGSGNNLWSPTSPWVANPINETESGLARGSSLVWTGTNCANGNADRALGTVGTVKYGDTVVSAPPNDWTWCSQDQATYTDLHSFYALSEPLTLIPEPATLALLGLGACGIVFGRRRSRKS